MSTSVVHIRGACPHDCPDTCAFLTEVSDGVALKVRGNPAHTHTHGTLCAKVNKYTERTYHPERLLYPMRRVGAKGAGQYERVSWASALSDIAARLKAIAAVDPQAILPYSYAGTMGLVQSEGMAARFFNKLGASQLDRTICSAAGTEALMHTLGGKVGMKVEFFAEAKLIIIWGSNSITSNLHFWRYVQEAKRLGAKIWCIDPRRTETAEKCHEHIQLLPGTDAALALGIMHELIVHGWLDEAYISKYTSGWLALKERAMLWNSERAAQICGVPEAQIIQIAKEYGEAAQRGEPVAIRLNYGMQRVRGGGNAARAVSCLPALVGAWRHRGGGLLLSSSGMYPVNRAALSRPDLAHGKTPRTINMSTIGDDLLRDASPEFGSKIQAVMVYNSNPVAVAPESGKVVQGFAREDLFTVVLEHFQTDTADYADYILPATTQLEHWDIHLSYGHTDVMLNQPAIQPVGEAKPNSQIFRELAALMGYTEACFADGDETLCRTAFEGVVDFDVLLRDGFATLNVPDAPFAKGGFPTASGKCEFESRQYGLPDHLPNYEVASSDARFPLAMISPPARNFLNSTFVNVKSLRDMEGEPLLEISVEDAAQRSIADGSIVRIFNDRGTYRCKAVISPRARSGVVHGLGIWWRKMGLDGKNVNELTSQRLTDMGRGPVFYDCAVQVSADAL